MCSTWVACRHDPIVAGFENLNAIARGRRGFGNLLPKIEEQHGGYVKLMEGYSRMNATATTATATVTAAAVLVYGEWSIWKLHFPSAGDL